MLLRVVISFKSSSTFISKIAFPALFSGKLILCFILGNRSLEVITLPFIEKETFIFSLAPILCGLFIIQLDEFLDLRVKNNIKLFSILLILFVTLKYHLVFD